MIINIDITEEQEKFLRQFAEKQHEGARDNLDTRKPIHLVQTEETEFIWDNGESGGEIGYCSDELQGYYTSEVEILKQISGFTDIIPFEEAEYQYINGVLVYDIQDYFEAYGVEGCSKVSIVHRYKNVAYFFTLVEARRYMKYQSHNLNNPRTFTVDMGYSNKGDYEPFFDLLMSIGTNLLKGDVRNEEKES